MRVGMASAFSHKCDPSVKNVLTCPLIKLNSNYYNVTLKYNRVVVGIVVDYFSCQTKESSHKAVPIKHLHGL